MDLIWTFCYLSVLIGLSGYGLHRYFIVYLFLKNRKRAPQPLSRFAQLPVVTVQLPLFNEIYVVERLLKSVSDQAAACLLNIQLSQRLSQAKQLEAFQAMSAFFVHDLKNTASTLSLMLKNFPAHYQDPTFREDALRGTVDDPSASVSVSVAGQTYAASNNGDGTWTLAASGQRSSRFLRESAFRNRFHSHIRRRNWRGQNCRVQMHTAVSPTRHHKRDIHARKPEYRETG